MGKRTRPPAGSSFAGGDAGKTICVTPTQEGDGERVYDIDEEVGGSKRIAPGGQCVPAKSYLVAHNHRLHGEHTEHLEKRRANMEKRQSEQLKEEEESVRQSPKCKNLTEEAREAVSIRLFMEANKRIRQREKTAGAILAKDLAASKCKIASRPKCWNALHNVQKEKAAERQTRLLMEAVKPAGTCRSVEDGQALTNRLHEELHLREQAREHLVLSYQKRERQFIEDQSVHRFTARRGFDEKAMIERLLDDKRSLEKKREERGHELLTEVTRRKQSEGRAPERAASVDKDRFRRLHAEAAERSIKLEALRNKRGNEFFDQFSRTPSEGCSRSLQTTKSEGHAPDCQSRVGKDLRRLYVEATERKLRWKADVLKQEAKKDAQVERSFELPCHSVMTRCRPSQREGASHTSSTSTVQCGHSSPCRSHQRSARSAESLCARRQDSLDPSDSIQSFFRFLRRRGGSLEARRRRPEAVRSSLLAPRAPPLRRHSAPPTANCSCEGVKASASSELHRQLGEMRKQVDELQEAQRAKAAVAADAAAPRSLSAPLLWRGDAKPRPVSYLDNFFVQIQELLRGRRRTRDAARRIQARWRGALARRLSRRRLLEVQRSKLEEERFKLEEVRLKLEEKRFWAACKIQAEYRRWKTEAELRLMAPSTPSHRAKDDKGTKKKGKTKAKASASAEPERKDKSRSPPKGKANKSVPSTEISRAGKSSKASAVVESPRKIKLTGAPPSSRPTSAAATSPKAKAKPAAKAMSSKPKVKAKRSLGRCSLAPPPVEAATAEEQPTEEALATDTT